MRYTRAMTFPAPICLQPSDAERYARLRMRMLVESPWAFGASPDDDRSQDTVQHAKTLVGEGYAIFAIEAPRGEHRGPGDGDVDLIASAGVSRWTSPKFRHRATVWGVYVEPLYRGRGLGRAVMTAVVDAARSWPDLDYVDLGVSERASGAWALYRSLGFVAWGREPEATEHEGERYDEIHMTLRL